MPPTTLLTIMPIRATPIPLGPCGMERVGMADVALEGWDVEVVADMFVDSRCKTVVGGVIFQQGEKIASRSWALEIDGSW